MSPKFKTKLKDKDPRKWYIFLQIYDIKRLGFIETETRQTATWEINFRIISGRNDSIVANKQFAIDFYRTPAPSGQLTVTRLPGYPDEYYNAFDSIAQMTVSDDPELYQSVKLHPACIYKRDDYEKNAIRKITFKSSFTQIEHESDPAFIFVRQSVNHEKMGKGKNIAGNTASGAVTLLTGIRSDKRKNTITQRIIHLRIMIKSIIVSWPTLK